MTARLMNDCETLMMWSMYCDTEIVWRRQVPGNEEGQEFNKNGYQTEKNGPPKKMVRTTIFVVRLSTFYGPPFSTHSPTQDCVRWKVYAICMSYGYVRALL